jgi:rubrerythrin
MWFDGKNYYSLKKYKFRSIKKNKNGSRSIKKKKHKESELEFITKYEKTIDFKLFSRYGISVDFFINNILPKVVVVDIGVVDYDSRGYYLHIETMMKDDYEYVKTNMPWVKKKIHTAIFWGIGQRISDKIWELLNTFNIIIASFDKFRRITYIPFNADTMNTRVFTHNQVINIIEQEQLRVKSGMKEQRNFRYICNECGIGFHEYEDRKCPECTACLRC